ncbi:RAD1 isoform 5 [Pongo abelii]|uniref:RAD1 isoform 4 n=1 Tax=Pongo abelii TaxID=9601 RepID=A0A2J8WAY2_PONAB|nr:RAD1 isoform 4 [Pongo abelii]PNJ66947.1 RAD1 isoform 5 [Pongo abelii]
MPLLTQQIQDEDDQYSLVASLDNVRNLSTILKAIHFREHATCFATKNGIKVTVENAKCVQANAFIQHDLRDREVNKTWFLSSCTGMVWWLTPVICSGDRG